MNTFAFIIHPIDPKRDVSRKYPFLGKVLSENQINFFSTFFPPVYISEIHGIRSEATGESIKGYFIACPYTPKKMMQLPVKTVYKKIIQTGKMAEKLGADILGLGAFTSVVGDAGITISNNLNIPVTTGDSYTVAVAVKALEQAAEQMEIEIGQSGAAVVGATGAIGQVCSALLADKAKTVYLIGKNQKRLDELKTELENKNVKAELIATTDITQIKNTRLILTVSSDTGAIIHPEHLQPGSVICDVARPRDVSAKVAQQRDDILVIDGGVVEVPGSVDFNFDFGFPAGKAYACMAETFALTLENKLESYTLGKKITRAQVQEIDRIATRHGFRLSGFRSFEKTITNEQIDKIKLHAHAARQYN